MVNTSERLIYDRITNTSAGAGTNDLRRNKVKPGRIEKISIVSVENLTTAYTSLRIGYSMTGFSTPTLRRKTQCPESYILLPTESFYVRVNSYRLNSPDVLQGTTWKCICMGYGKK